MEQLETTDSEIVNRLNTAYRKVKVVGKEVFVPPIYSRRSLPYRFHVKQLRFLYHLAQTNDLQKACKEAGVSESYARKFLKSNDYKAFAAEAVEDEAIHDGWTSRRVIVELNDIYAGKVVSQPQFEALKELRQILVPRLKDSGVSHGSVTVNLNLPAYPPHIMAKLKDLADEAATIDITEGPGGIEKVA